MKYFSLLLVSCFRKLASPPDLVGVILHNYIGIYAVRIRVAVFVNTPVIHPCKSDQLY